MPFDDALRLQEEAVLDPARREQLLLLEHDPVYTTGRGGAAANLPGGLDRGASAEGTPVVRIGRGGDATYHGPGQLVGYPIVDLRARGGDVHRFLRALEEGLIAVLQEFGLRGERCAGRTGVWVRAGSPGRAIGSPAAAGKPPAKIASIGIGVRRGMSLHGFALNVSVDLAAFAAIVPCGIPGVEMTSLAACGVRPVPELDRVADLAARAIPAAIDAALPCSDRPRGNR